MPQLFSDTKCTSDNGTTSWEAIYKLFMDEEPRVIKRVAMGDASSSYETTYSDVTNSFLHRIFARKKILSYIDMVKWIIDNLNIVEMTFLNSTETIIGSFKDEYLEKMYHIPDPQKIYHKNFLQKFAEGNKLELEPIRQWIYDLDQT